MNDKRWIADLKPENTTTTKKSLFIKMTSTKSIPTYLSLNEIRITTLAVAALTIILGAFTLALVCGSTKLVRKSLQIVWDYRMWTVQLLYNIECARVTNRNSFDRQKSIRSNRKCHIAVAVAVDGADKKWQMVKWRIDSKLIFW